MTDTATDRETRVGALLPHGWWARGLNLRERLAAPDAPASAAGAASGGRPAPWSCGDAEGFAARLASLGVGAGLAHGLAQEAPARLAGRAAKPHWAAYIERAVAEVPGARQAIGRPDAEDSRDGAQGADGSRAADGSQGAYDAEADGARLFLPVLRPLISLAWAEVEASADSGEAELAAVRPGFEERLGERLTRQAARTLVKELNLARAAGELPGRTPQDRFAAFLARLGTPQGLAGLFTRYPVLARMLGQACGYAAEATAELLDRFAADRPEIVKELLQGTDPGELVRMDLGRGDAHQGNRSVALLHFADGATVVYKPRPLGQHELLDRAVGWLNAKVPGLGLRTPRTVHGAGHGWLEFIGHHGCESVTELDRFYRRQGALLALLYAVDGVDMHYENVIASGDQPVLVDAETLLHTGLPAAMTAGPDPAAEALQASVHRTCLLPSLLIGENGGLDISSLGGGAGGAYPSDDVCWEGAGTDEMRVRRAAVVCQAGQNRPVLKGGRATGHTDHRAALLEGFRAGYEAIAGHRAELLGAHAEADVTGTGGGLLNRWAAAEGRLIARSTRLYATLLDESAHPDVLGDALARESVFALLWSESVHDPARQRLVEDEIADLWCGDVPLFFHHPAGTAVRTTRGDRLEGLLPAAGLDTVRRKIAAMSEVDRYDQEWIISATLAVSSANSGAAHPRSVLAQRPAPAEVPEPNRLLAAACGIADELAARAVPGAGRVNWLGLEQVSGAHWAVLPMGAGLAQGYTGAALFLAQIGALAGAERYTALARQAVRPLPELLAALAAEPELSAAAGPGALHGLGGIVYAVARLSALFGEAEGDPAGIGRCLPDALAALELAAEADPDGPCDLADGLAGALAVTVAVAGTPGTPGAAGARALAGRLADRLLDRLGGATPAPGFAHGDAGIGWALLRYAAGRPEARRHAEAGTALLRSALDTALLHPGHLDWSTGLAGTALAAADALGDGAGTGAALDRSTALLAAAPQAADLSLQHGTLGALELLSVRAARGHHPARGALTRHTGELLGRLAEHGHRCGTPDQVPSPGLLAGLSGIGYALLRLGFPEAVPSVLLLEHTSR
ncbi:type 2 lanthipeptide synthetase LanM family protein [Streptomyces venezuelae]|uniref:type 2 lanthipeptide synthetase LanM family protein n=1 Tax=Streptomyces venezuelae TaxID=54571 RepID=UPI001CC261F8|nr:type 2 lanthipeptide synthetase LanM family protein [Streptomyces venezuelae]